MVNMLSYLILDLASGYLLSLGCHTFPKIARIKK